MQAETAYRAHDWDTMGRVMEQLGGYPETKRVEAGADIQKAYFALASWYWREQAEEYRDELHDAGLKSLSIYGATLDASERVLEAMIWEVSHRCGDWAGAPEPTTHEVCTWFLTKIREAMQDALGEAEARFRAARDATIPTGTSEAD